jgi:hypothetical protein
LKTIDSSLLQADPVISEVRRVKTAFAAKHNFDVMAMIQALQEREKEKIRIFYGIRQFSCGALV